MNKITTICSFLYLVSLSCVPLLASAECTCDTQKATDNGDSKTLHYKLVAISSILAACVLGISLPILGKKTPCLDPEKNIFFLIKGFAGGVILATGFVHILPKAFESLTSSCLKEHPWDNFPFTGFIAMLSAIITMAIDTFATSYSKKSRLSKALPLDGDEEMQRQHEDHSHAQGSALSDAPSADMRHRIISKVLELGIVVHSVIIGVSLGASTSTRTVKPLVAALTFHQFFEGIGLGGCIVQANLKSREVAVMSLFFCLTTPLGIAIGIAISTIYNNNSPTALAVEGVLESASAGILIYMALVDLLAADFMSPKMQANLRLQLGANLSLLLGIACMSLLAIWA